MDRRTFLRKGLVLLAAPAIVPASSLMRLKGVPLYPRPAFDRFDTQWTTHDLLMLKRQNRPPLIFNVIAPLVRP